MSQTVHRWGLSDSMYAGAGAGLVSSIATIPLDVIKTKLQAQRAAHSHANYLGVLGTAKDVFRRDGIKGFYRGLGPTILGYLPTWAIYFAVYDGIKSRMANGEPLVETVRRGGIYPAPTPKGYQPHAREHPWSVHILSAAIAGASSTIATNPLWVIKTRFMTQSVDERRYRHTLDAFLTIYRAEGVRAFYRGLLPSLLGIFHVAVQFPLYEQLKRWARGPNDTPPSSTMILLCSGASKMVASIATYPHEVVRTRLQIQRRALTTAPLPEGAPAVRHHGFVGTTVEIIHREGWRGLYKGLSINLFRTVPNSAVTMLTYELLMRYLSEKDRT